MFITIKIDVKPMGQFNLETNPYQILSFYLRNVDYKPTEKTTNNMINTCDVNSNIA